MMDPVPAGQSIVAEVSEPPPSFHIPDEDDPQIVTADSPEAKRVWATQFYDPFMKENEPDLVSGEVNGLKEKYKGETPEQSEARSKRYEEAFAKFNESMKKEQEAWNKELAAYKKTAFASAEIRDRKEEALLLITMEKSFEEASVLPKKEKKK